jgi:TPP-dependent pyruvate/acetoin dehydrogenase alpha subunit
LYRSQFEIRLVEKRAYDLFLQNLIKGTSHLAIGQEAIAAAFGVSMKRGDWSFCTYRGHAHTLARGSSMTGVLGELMGRECGLMGGKGGSMHLTDIDHGVMGSYAIIGAHLPIAMGAAWSAHIGAPTRSRYAFSATARPTSAPSTKHSRWPLRGNSRWCSCAKTIFTWNTRGSRT